MQISSALEMTAGVSSYWMLQYEAEGGDFGKGKVRREREREREMIRRPIIRCLTSRYELA